MSDEALMRSVAESVPDTTGFYEDRVPVNYKVADLTPDFQPREKVLKYGISALSNAELFAIILRTGTQGFPITHICQEIMRMNDNMFLNLERRSREELLEYEGIGPVKAMQVEAIMEIVRRYNRESIGDRYRITSPDSIYQLMKPEIANLPHEEIWALFLNRQNQVIAKLCISKGSSTCTVFDVKKIIRNALFSRAEGVVLCHNHPSGNLRPSGQDDAITQKLKNACMALDISFLDHLILTTDGYFSYSESTSIIR